MTLATRLRSRLHSMRAHGLDNMLARSVAVRANIAFGDWPEREPVFVGSVELRDGPEYGRVTGEWEQ